MGLNISMLDRALDRIAILDAKIDSFSMSRHDAEFNEADHPRAPDGKFGSGSGSMESANRPAERTRRVQSQLEAEGFETSATHHNAAGGMSSYLNVFDPQSKRYFKARISDHLKGNPGNMVGMMHILPGDDESSIIQMAREMRELGASVQNEDNGDAEKIQRREEQRRLEESSAATKEAIRSAYPAEWEAALNEPTKTRQNKAMDLLKKRYKAEPVNGPK